MIEFKYDMGLNFIEVEDLYGIKFYSGTPIYFTGVIKFSIYISLLLSKNI